MTEEIVVQDPRFTIATERIGNYCVVRIRGKYDNDILDLLRTKVFWENVDFAVDASQLQGIALPLARELVYTDKLLRDVDHRIVLLRPPDRLKSLLTMHAPESPLPQFFREEQLHDPDAVEDQQIPAAREFERIRTELRSNALWRVLDREGCWICPYCGDLAQDVQPGESMLVPMPVIEKIYRHLWFGCKKFSFAKPVMLTVPELEGARKRHNELKIVVTKRRMSAMETKITQLTDRAKKADALEYSVKIGAERQKRILPARAPIVEGLEIGIVYRPAEQISGDFYDFLLFPDGRVGFLIGDVSGHGIEAGILMGMAKKILAVRLEELGDPAKAVKRANKDLFRDLDRQSFVTAFVAIYDPATRSITAARAGHNPPFLYHPDRQPRLLSFEKGGLGVGLNAGDTFDKTLVPETVEVRSGDLFLLYTDGLVEAKNSEGEEFGVERVSAVLDLTAGSPAPFVLSDLSTALDEFTGSASQEDDVTAVGVKFL